MFDEGRWWNFARHSNYGKSCLIEVIFLLICSVRLDYLNYITFFQIYEQ
jgi:hypothetical protein